MMAASARMSGTVAPFASVLKRGCDSAASERDLARLARRALAAAAE